MRRLLKLRLSGRQPLQVLLGLLGKLLLVDFRQQERSLFGKLGLKLLMKLRQLFDFGRDSFDFRAENIFVACLDL